MISLDDTVDKDNRDNLSLISQEELEDNATWDNINEFFGETDFNALKEISEKISYDIKDYISKPAISDDWTFSKDAVSLVLVSCLYHDFVVKRF